MKSRPRSVTVDCDSALAQRLGEAIRCYAEAAYPPGGSECAQVARETLLDTAAKCSGHAGGALELPKRQLAMLKAALRWYCENDGAGDAFTAGRIKRLFD